MGSETIIDCLLIYPKPTLESPKLNPALSIFYVGATLEQYGFEVEYIDLRIDKFDRVSEIVKHKDPLCVGVSSMTGHQLEGAIEVLKAVKRIKPTISTVLGGVHPSLLPEQCLQEEFVDFVVIGEGEKTMVELLMELKKASPKFETVAGLAWKKNKKVVINQRRPFLKSEEWVCPLTEKTKRYFEISAKRNSMYIATSRGCIYRCGFCYNIAFNLRIWRPMKIEHLERQLDLLQSELDFDFVYLGDDEIGKNYKRIEKICNTLKKRGLCWHTGMRCDHITKKLANLLDNSGCTSIELGAETGSQRILQEIIHKDYPNGVKDIQNCAKILSETNISGMYSFMCGLPSETLGELKISMNLADWIKKIDKKARISFFVYIPYPGTPLFEFAIRQGFKAPATMHEWSEYTLSSPVKSRMENLYYLAGIQYRKDNLSKNFPGLKRLVILPFELSAYIRWKMRLIDHYLEKPVVKRLIEIAVRQKELIEF